MAKRIAGLTQPLQERRDYGSEDESKNQEKQEDRPTPEQALEKT